MQPLEIKQEDENISHWAGQAFLLMAKHEVPPSPDNYAVWFLFSSGKSHELISEINSLIKNKLKFSPETCSYLHHKFLANSRNQKALDDAALGGQKILLEVLRVINDFSGETESYNQDVDGYIAHIGQEFPDGEMQGIFKELISATANLRQSGQKMSKKLEESTSEINILRKSLQQVTIEAQRDFLTGVFNRKTFEKLLDEQMLAAKEQGGELSLLMIDIDHFKRFNDRFGHLLGDEVLKIVARALTETLKGRDVVARFGGEEFVAFLPNTPIDGAMKVAEMIRAAIASKELKRKDNGENFGTITVSIGVSRLHAQTDTLPMIVKRADDALYQSKRSGRNRATREDGQVMI